MRRNFTVVELLAVMIIFGILAVIAMPSFVRTRELDYNSEAIANVKLIYYAMDMYRMETGCAFPGEYVVMNTSQINDYLHLNLRAGIWYYYARGGNYSCADFMVTANRSSSAPPSYYRTFYTYSNLYTKNHTIYCNDSGTGACPWQSIEF